MSYKEMSEYYFYQLNLNFGNGNYYQDKVFVMQDPNTGEIMSQNIKCFYKSRDYYYNIYYNEHKKLKSNLLLMMQLLH